MTLDCEVCGSDKANRKAKIEGSVLRVCDKCVKLGEEIPIFVKKKRNKTIKKGRGKKGSSMTIGDIVEVG